MDPQLYFSHQLTKEMALQHDDATIHASKKWENLTKYRFKSKFYLVTGLLDHMGAFCNFTLTVTLKFYCVPCFFLHSGSVMTRSCSGDEGGRTTAGRRPFFEAVHTARGQRDSIRPLDLTATAQDSDEEPRAAAPGPS